MSTTVKARPATGHRRSLVALFCGAASVNAATATAGAAATVLVADAWGTAAGGVPNAAAVAGTAGGVVVLTRLTPRYGRRFGLLVGAAAGTAGTALTVVGAWLPAVPVLLAGMLLLGIGNAAAQLSRYAAAELFGENRRGFVLGSVVWAGTFGAVGGPLLLGPVTTAAGSAGLPALAGAFALAACCLALAAGAMTLVARRPVPPTEERTLAGAWPVRTLLSRPDVRLALVAMLAAQVVMVGIMTAAPLEMHRHGQSMGLVGGVLSAHTFGMFALAPLSGRLTDALGGRRVIALGLVTLAVSAALVVGTASAGGGLPLALFVLGYGWNLVFVGASGLLARGLPYPVRARVQGLVDAWSWAAAAVAAVGSTAALGAVGYPPLAAATGTLVLVPAVLLVTAWRRAALPVAARRGAVRVRSRVGPRRRGARRR